MSSSQARFAEASLTVTADTNIVEPIISTSSERLIELSRTNFLPLIPLSQTTGSSYNNRPTGTVSPMPNISSTHPSPSAPLSSLLKTNTSSGQYI